MAFCEKCGTKFDESEKFCSGCGAPVGIAVAPVVAAKVEPARAGGKPCRNCGKTIEDGWLVCPYCKTEAGPKLCKGCKKELAEGWVVCQYCRTGAQ